MKNIEFTAKTRAERVRLIGKLIDDGQTSRQIAAQLGISRQRVCRIAYRAGITIGTRGGRTGRVGAWVPLRLVASLGSLANDAGVSQGVMLARVIEAVCADPAAARKLLGKDAMAVRKYGEAA